MRSLVIPILLSAAAAAQAATPQELLKGYAGQNGGQAFSAARGEALYRSEHKNADGVTLSCAACHSADPRQTGKTRANKSIEPLAPAANAKRFTDGATTEKWFRRNCGDVLGRECTAQEKGDFIAWLLSIK